MKILFVNSTQNSKPFLNFFRGMSMKAELKDGSIVITLDCEQKDPPLSASGKSRVVASTRGNVQTSLQVKGKNVTVGVNAYIPV
ncbi:hypothetical protein LCGC14_2970130 [marine sediment metagenome]|uniref:Uncharacterized protein n=1 Tax=marine sediment metagenome TaxID=412755 RepID=A0A0F8ZHB8_9ZZZZ